jgi:hypothetical protein
MPVFNLIISAGEMRRGADAGGGEIELAGIGLGVGDELGEMSSPAR